MSWLFSRVLAEEFSQASSSGTESSVQWKLNRSVAKGWPRDKTKAFYRPFQSGRDQLRLSTGGHGEELLTWYREAFLARTFPQQIPVQSEYLASVLASGEKCSAWSARLDRPSSLWRILRSSGAEVSEECSAIFPRSGMMRSGLCLELTISEASTSGRECSFWATPVASMPGQGDPEDPKRGKKLQDQVQLWATPLKRDHKSGSVSQETKEANSRPLSEQVTSWPTCRSTDGEKGGPNNKGSKGDLTLPSAVTLWPTILRSDSAPASAPRLKGDHPRDPSLPGNYRQDAKDQVPALWPTPTVTGNHNKKGLSPDSGDGLATAVQAALWPTPSTGGSNNESASVKDGKHGTNLQGAVQLWTTVQSHDSRGGSQKRIDRGSVIGGCKNLADEVHLWSTVTEASATGGQTSRSEDRAGELLLGGEVQIAFGGR